MHKQFLVAIREIHLMRARSWLLASLIYHNSRRITEIHLQLPKLS